jgi:hypothetical protein
MHHSTGLLALLEHVSSPGSPGSPRVALPAGVPTSLDALIRAPSSFDIHGEGLADTITTPLRTLAAMRDPVADAHAGWLVAVVAIASGADVRTDESLAAPSSSRLTPEGRAWLAEQARVCAQPSAIAAIDAALGISS